MINVIIIEDNSDAKNYLVSLLQKNFPNLNIVGFAETIKDSIKLINNTNPELVFLDIELKDGLSFEVLDAIDKKDFEIIFTTGYNNFYEKAIEHFAFHYLLKPIDLEKLKRVIDRYQDIKLRLFNQNNYSHLKSLINEKNSKILLNIGHEYVSVSINNIISFKADGNYTVFYLDNGKQYLVSNGLKYYDELLSPKGFFKANRSCIINISHIQSIVKKETIILSNNEKISVSTRNKQNVSELIKLLS